MSGWHPLSRDGGIPPNPALPTSPAQAYSPVILPIDTEPLYYGNGCDVRLRPHVLNSLISESLAVLDRIGLPYRPALLTNLRTAIEYITQKGLPRFVVLQPQASPVFNYIGVLDPPLLNGLNNGMTLTVLPSATNDGPVRIDLGNGSFLRVLRNDSEELEIGDWPDHVPQGIGYFDGTWYQLGLVKSQGARRREGGTGIINMRAFISPGASTYVKTEGTLAGLIFSTAGGGAGGCSAVMSNASGGDAGGTAVAFADLSEIDNIPLVNGPGGPMQPNTGMAGADGGNSVFGSPPIAGATGGGGGWAPWDDPKGNNPGKGTVGQFLMRGCPGSSATGGDEPGAGGSSFWGGMGGQPQSWYDVYIGAMPGIMGAGGGANWRTGGPDSPGEKGGDGLHLIFELG